MDKDIIINYKNKKYIKKSYFDRTKLLLDKLQKLVNQQKKLRNEIDIVMKNIDTQIFFVNMHVEYPDKSLDEIEVEIGKKVLKENDNKI